MAPAPLYPKLLQAKQAADLHSPSFNQRMVAEVMQDGFLDRHVPHHPRALQVAARRDAGRAGSARCTAWTCSWNTPGRRHVPVGAPAAGMNAVELLPQGGGHAAWPSCPARPSTPDARPTPRTLRLSFVTASAEQIDTGIAALAAAIREHRPGRSACCKIWGRISSINVRKVVLAAQWLDLPFERIDAGARIRHRARRPTTWRSNPNALVPLLEDGDFTLWESNVIVRYLCARHSPGKLYPQDAAPRASTPSAGWTGSRPRSTRPAARPSSS